MLRMLHFELLQILAACVLSDEKSVIFFSCLE